MTPEPPTELYVRHTDGRPADLWQGRELLARLSTPAHARVTFEETNSAVRWHTVVPSDGPAHGGPIDFEIELSRPADWTFWTAWGDPRNDAVGRTDAEAIFANGASPGDYHMDWVDPLAPVPLRDTTWHYVIHPGAASPLPVPIGRNAAGDGVVRVPLVRGAAVLVLA